MLYQGADFDFPQIYSGAYTFPIEPYEDETLNAVFEVPEKSGKDRKEEKYIIHLVPEMELINYQC